jgi:ring-1,2-phenylacetyl-CoA epoxidase subunit PaaD
MVNLSPEQVWAALQDVKDPEIPAVSVVDLGIIHQVQADGRAVTVVMTPTFVGCPAVDWMRDAIESKVRELGATDVTVRVSLDPPWTSERISEAGRRKLKEFGLAPPRPYDGLISLSEILPAACPHCNSSDTTLESAFGPTLCRAIHYCNACRQSFEQFKPL